MKVIFLSDTDRAAKVDDTIGIHHDTISNRKLSKNQETETDRLHNVKYYCKKITIKIVVVGAHPRALKAFIILIRRITHLPQKH